MTDAPPAENDPATAEGRKQDQGGSAGAPAGRSDEELMALLQRRDLGALEALYDRHHRIALALAYRVVGDFEAAEDVVQETFLSAWRQSSTYHRDRGRVRAWLLSIARHRAIDRIRRARPPGQLTELDPSVVDPRATDVLEAAEASVRRDRIVQALMTLSDEQRQAVELAYYGGLTHKEISEQTGLPLGTVKGRMRQAMDKLRLALADLAPDEGGTACTTGIHAPLSRTARRSRSWRPGTRSTRLTPLTGPVFAPTSMAATVARLWSPNSVWSPRDCPKR